MTISNDPNWGKPKKSEIQYAPFIVRDGTYLCVYDIISDEGVSLLINNVRVKKAPTGALVVRKINDYTAAAMLSLDTGVIYKGMNLRLLKPKSNSTTYQQAPSPSDMDNAYYIFDITYNTDSNDNLMGVVAYYQDVSAAAGVLAKCVVKEDFKEIISKPSYGYY